MDGDLSTIPACPVKLERSDYDSSNGYGEPLAKRANTTVTNQPAQAAPTLTTTNRNQSNGTADANVTLWQFLLDLLLKQQYSSIICWTNNEGEFKLLDAEQVAKLWGLKKNKNNMNYDKLSRALRYYYDKNIIKKVMGQKFVYKFVSFPEMVKTENRIPFKKKMESIVNDANPATSTPLSTAMSGFQTLRPYDVKAGLIHSAQFAATAFAQQQQMLRDHAVVQAMAERKYQIPPEHMSLYHNGNSHQAKLSPAPAAERSLSCSPTPSQNQHVVTSETIQNEAIGRSSPSVTSMPLSSVTAREAAISSLHQLSPPVTPVSVCTPAASPSPTRVFDLPCSNTPTPPPKPASPVKHRENEVKVKLEIPDIDDSKDCEKTATGGIEGRRSSKQSKLKPDPLSLNNDVVINPSVTSPLMTRGLLGSLNTPMFMTSPMFGQRTPLIPGIHLWGPGTLSPAGLSPRFGGGLHAGPAFQFPAFAVSPATLASFGSFHDSVFTSSAATSSAPNGDKKTLY